MTIPTIREILEDLEKRQQEERAVLFRLAQAWEDRERAKQDELEAIERNRRREAPAE